MVNNAERAQQDRDRSPQLPDYPAFWAHYLREHGRPGTRAVHYLGTAGALLLLLAALLLGYGFAWIGHAALEGNRPATFGHPLWSFASDLRMLGLFATGRLGPHLERHLKNHLGRENDMRAP
jgi:hypothetical protein